MNEKFVIDEEFKQLIPSISDEEFKQLEQNCIKDGVRDALITWKGILIDGHNRYRIIQKYSLPYQTKEMNFSDRNEAMAWIIKNQFGRRNLSAYDRSLLALKLKPIIAEQAKTQQKSHTEQGYQKSDKAVHTTKEIAKIADVSHDTIHKVETIEKSDNEYIKAQARKGDLSINMAYNMVTNKSPKKSEKEFIETVKQRHDEFNERKNGDVVSMEDIQKDKKDQYTLALTAYQLCLTAGKKLDDLAMDIKANGTDLKLMSANISGERKQVLSNALVRWISIIAMIQKEVDA